MGQHMNTLLNFIYSRQPKFNRELAEGVAFKQMQRPEQYIDRIWKCAERLFQSGLTYEGYKVCSPLQRYQLSTMKAEDKHFYDISRSDVYAVKFIFHLHGEPLLEKVLLMPFPGPGGTINLRGTEYLISPVLCDRSFSVAGDSLFIPLVRARLTFHRFSWQVAVNGRSNSIYVHHSTIYNHQIPTEVRKHRDFVDTKTTLPLYMLAKYGFARAFVEFFGIEPVVDYDDVNPENYPPEKWTIFSSSGSVPTGVRSNSDWRPTTLRIAVENSELNETLESMIAGFFYTADCFPDRIVLEDLNEVRLWRTIWGLSCFGPADGEGLLVSKTEAHLDSIDKYVDDEVQRYLFKDGIVCHDIYELFLYVMDNMTTIMLNNDGNRMDGKRLTVLKYVMYDVVHAIFNLSFQLNPKAKELSKKEIINKFNRFLNSELIMRLTNTKHGEINAVNSPSDSMVIKHTSKVIPQAAANKSGNRDRSGNFEDESLSVDASFLYCGSTSYLPKYRPVGDTNLNLFGLVSPDGELQIEESERENVNKWQEMLNK